MYSVVLMAALSTGGGTPDSHWCGSHGGYATLATGCYGCAGGFSGYACAGYWHCSGAWYGGWVSCAGCFGCHGCYGCYGCYGCTGWAPGVPMAPAAAPAGPGAAAPPGVEKAPPPKPEGKQSSLPSKSRLTVELPQNAKLYIDDRLINTASGKRTFNTPTLEPGQLYYYIVRAEVELDGKTYSESKRVLVCAGEEVKASFPELESQLALARR